MLSFTFFWSSEFQLPSFSPTRREELLKREVVGSEQNSISERKLGAGRGGRTPAAIAALLQQTARRAPQLRAATERELPNALEIGVCSTTELDTQAGRCVHLLGTERNAKGKISFPYILSPALEAGFKESPMGS